MGTMTVGKVLTLPEARAWRERLGRVGQRVVLTNGCFDLLHLGHVRALAAARALGDGVIVGVNSDRSVTALKGPGRPLLPQDERAEVLAALRAVDAVTIFDELTAVALIESLRPDIYVKGADYADPGPSGVDERRLPEAAVVRRLGGIVRLVTVVPGHSTSDLIARITSSGQAAQS